MFKTANTYINELSPTLGQAHREVQSHTLFTLTDHDNPLSNPRLYANSALVEGFDRAARIMRAAERGRYERIEVILFKPNGRYYTTEEWRIPEGAIDPRDMKNSPDFHRISGGPVLITSQEPWGYPHVFPAES